MASLSSRLSVVKLGGSVLTSVPAYAVAASYLARAVCRNRSTRVVAVVSAEFGHTDRLAREAQELAGAPDPATRDLLWSTGELRSVALLTLALKHAGVSAVALNAHETGLRADEGERWVAVNPIALRAALAHHAVAVVPGFLATRHHQVITLGRGGSDLSAVVLAAALGADECVLVKDVDGYFSADPALHAEAEPIGQLSYADAIAMADEGCPLVQRQALVEAQRVELDVVVKSLVGTGTIVSQCILGRRQHHGIRHEDDSRRTTNGTGDRRGGIADLPDHHVPADWSRRASGV